MINKVKPNDFQILIIVKQCEDIIKTLLINC